MSAVATGDHVIQEVLGDLGGLAAAGVASYDHHLVRLETGDDGTCLGGDRESLAVLQTLAEREREGKCYQQVSDTHISMLTFCRAISFPFLRLIS